MSRIYRTKQGDVLDAICHRELGSEQHVHAVLDANPGLASKLVVLEKGIEIVLPNVIEPQTNKVINTVRLWG